MSLQQVTYLYHIIAGNEDQDGIVPFVIDYTDLNGNDYGDITSTTDSSYVRFDGTNPVFPMVYISSDAADSIETFEVSWRYQHFEPSGVSF